MIKLSIVIVNWNVRDLLRCCLQSLRKVTKSIDFEIFVVDNASADGSVEMIKAEFPEVTLIANKENQWFPKANNQALKLVKGEYTLLLNPDTVVKEDALKKMIGFMDVHPEIGMSGPKIFLPDGRIQYECARELPTLSGAFFFLFFLKTAFPYHKIFAKEYFGGWDHKTSRIVPAISGACMLIRTKLLKDIGFLDETIPMYFEDIDLCKKVNNTSSKIYYLGDAEITHYAGQSLGKQKSPQMIRQYEFPAYQRFFRKYHPPIKLFMFNVLLMSASLLRIIIIFPFWLLLIPLRKRKPNAFSLSTLKKYLNAFKTGSH
jgi:GT2 family glycosyltransferase